MCLIHRCTQAELDKVTGMPIPKVATKDITVYKLLVNKQRGVYEAIFHGGTYEKGFHYYQVPDKSTDKNGFSVCEDRPSKGALILTFRICIGLHSYREKPKKSPYPLSKSNLEFVEMFIPEGALYYEGDNGIDLVSNELIYADKDKMPIEEWDEEEEGYIEVQAKKIVPVTRRIVARPARKQVLSPKKPIKKAVTKKAATKLTKKKAGKQQKARK